MTDPWKHRSEGMCCKTCMWNVQKVGEHLEKPNKIGRCRKHAPTMGGYPVVFENDWCGDHKLDENKVLPEQESVSAGPGIIKCDNGCCIADLANPMGHCLKPVLETEFTKSESEEDSEPTYKINWYWRTNQEPLMKLRERPYFGSVFS